MRLDARGAVVLLSGGIDSAVAARLALAEARAIWPEYRAWSLDDARRGARWQEDRQMNLFGES